MQIPEKYKKIIKGRKNLRCYKDKSDLELYAMLLKQEEKKKHKKTANKTKYEKIGYLKDTIQTVEDKNVALELFEKYSAEFAIEYESDKQDLYRLILQEINERHLQKAVAEKMKSDVYDPDDQDNLRKLQREITNSKNSIGMSRSKRAESKEDPFTYIEEVQDRCVKYIKAHKEEFTFKCSFCGKFNLLWKRHPFLGDDKHGRAWSSRCWELYKQNKLSLDNMAYILDTHSDFLKVMAKEKELELNLGDREE